jgi:hypothetical protein
MVTAFIFNVISAYYSRVPKISKVEPWQHYVLPSHSTWSISSMRTWRGGFEGDEMPLLGELSYGFVLGLWSVGESLGYCSLGSFQDQSPAKEGSCIAMWFWLVPIWYMLDCFSIVWECGTSILLNHMLYTTGGLQQLVCGTSTGLSWRCHVLFCTGIIWFWDILRCSSCPSISLHLFCYDPSIVQLPLLWVICYWR